MSRRGDWEYPDYTDWEDEERMMRSEERQIFIGAGFGFGFCFPRQFFCFPRQFCFPRRPCFPF